MRAIPSAAAISRMKECFDWLLLLNPEDARILWLGAKGPRPVLQIDMLPFDRLVPHIGTARTRGGVDGEQAGLCRSIADQGLMSLMRRMSTIGSTGDGSKPAAM
jgi:hypothetical protein